MLSLRVRRGFHWGIDKQGPRDIGLQLSYPSEGLDAARKERDRGTEGQRFAVWGGANGGIDFAEMSPGRRSSPVRVLEQCTVADACRRVSSYVLSAPDQ